VDFLENYVTFLRSRVSICSTKRGARPGRNGGNWFETRIDGVYS
jgi:hypothetical protein